jgi:Phage integrase, N-terminal SAM-like domain
MNNSNTSYRGITRLARNRYEVRARATDPKTGKRKDVERIWNGSIQGALDLQRQLHDELKGNATKRERVTLGVFARSWLERAVVRMRPSSANAYAGRLNHILAMLGDHYVDALRPADVEAYQSKRIADGAAGSTIRGETSCCGSSRAMPSSTRSPTGISAWVSRSGSSCPSTPRMSPTA